MRAAKSDLGCGGASSATEEPNERAPLKPWLAVARMSSTPRARPMAGAKEGASPRASKPAAAGDKKPKAKKPKATAPTAPMTLGMPMQKPADLSEDQAKADLAEMQKKYGTLVVTFNNQQAELAASQKLNQQLEAELEALKASQGSMPVEDSVKALRSQLEQTSAVSCGAQQCHLGPPRRRPGSRRALCQRDCQPVQIWALCALLRLLGEDHGLPSMFWCTSSACEPLR